jgi:hypothetical protein
MSTPCLVRDHRVDDMSTSCLVHDHRVDDMSTEVATLVAFGCLLRKTEYGLAGQSVSGR